MNKRLQNKFQKLKEQNKTGLITYIMAFDPDREKSLEILKGMPESGADIIELGMPFSDPMADGPAIQAAGIRALKSGAKLKSILQMVEEFRKNDDETPIVLMGYYNPIYYYGLEKFANDAEKAGVDGLLIVDLPPEEDSEFYSITEKHQIDLIKLIAPTTPDERIKKITDKAGGFIYHVAIAGITGTKSASFDSISENVERIRKHTSLPIAVGFGIKTPEDAKQAGKNCDAVIVGSAIVDMVAKKDKPHVFKFVNELSACLN